MILGITVPRLYTSWVATYLKLETTTPIVPPSKGKKKTKDEILKSLQEVSKSWGKEGSKYLNALIWRTFL